MSERAVAIALKIPDNEAYTALAALRRLGMVLAGLERSDVWVVRDQGDPATLAARVEANEAVFNPNKHRLLVLAAPEPRPGEAWIEEIAARDEIRSHLGGKAIAGITSARRHVAWRLYTERGTPAPREVVAQAIERLLCNPAIEAARY